MTVRGRHTLMLALGMLLESSLALAGVRVPLLPLLAVGTGVRRDALRLLPTQLLAAAALDALWCHRIPAELLALLAAAALGAAIRRAAAVSWVTLALAGAAVAAVPVILATGGHASPHPVWGQLLAGLLLTPALGALAARLLRRPVVWDERHGGVVVSD